MTRDEEIDILCVKAGKGDFVKDIINQIYDEHEAQLSVLSNQLLSEEAFRDEAEEKLEALKRKKQQTKARGV